MRLRHLAGPLYSLWCVVLVGCAAAGVLALSIGAVVAGVLALVLSAAMASTAVWRWRIAPRGRDADAAYRDLEAAIDASPSGELRCGNTVLITRPSRLLPEVCRYTNPDTSSEDLICDSYVLMWAPPLILRHTGIEEDHGLRDIARYAWHTIRTGQSFAGAAEIRTLAAQLRAARPDSK